MQITLNNKIIYATVALLEIDAFACILKPDYWILEETNVLDN